MLPLLITQFLYVQWWDEIAFVFNVTIMQCCCLCVQCVHVEFMIFSVWLCVCVCVLWCWLFVLCTITICRWWWFINVCSKTFTTCETDLFMLNVHFITINKCFFFIKLSFRHIKLVQLLFSRETENCSGATWNTISPWMEV